NRGARRSAVFDSSTRHPGSASAAAATWIFNAPSQTASHGSGSFSMTNSGRSALKYSRLPAVIIADPSARAVNQAERMSRIVPTPTPEPVARSGPPEFTKAETQENATGDGGCQPFYRK